MKPSEVPVRSPGTVDVSWWNTLRTAAIWLENLIAGAGAIAKTTFTIANGQAAAANVTGLSFSSATVKAATVEFHLRRKTDSSNVVAKGRLHCFYRQDDSSWDISSEFHGDELGITFSITAAGQVQYVSDTLAGSNYTSTMTFVATTIDV